MDKSSFHERADEFLSEIVEAIEIADEKGAVDAELIEGILTIEISDDVEYVINKHEPTKQIWVSSPESGASRLSYSEDDNDWQNSDEHSFKDIISDEMARIANIDVEF